MYHDLQEEHFTRPTVVAPRIIIAILVVQALAIGFLTYALLDISRELGSISAVAPRATEYDDNAYASQDGEFTAEHLTEAQLRRIIAEEISAGIGDVTRTELPAAAVVNASTAERSDQTERVAEEIEYHISVGSISTADMESLQGRIARLDPADRKRMLNKLVSAMNAGLIDGRF